MLPGHDFLRGRGGMASLTLSTWSRERRTLRSAGLGFKHLLATPEKAKSELPSAAERPGNSRLHLNDHLLFLLTGLLVPTEAVLADPYLVRHRNTCWP